MSADSTRDQSPRVRASGDRNTTHRHTQEKVHGTKPERVKGRARERLPFSDNKENNIMHKDKENFIIPQTPSYRTPKGRNNKNVLESMTADSAKPRSPLMAKQLPVALDDTCRLTLLLLNMTCPVLANSVDPDQLASEEANRSGSALFVIKHMNLYQQPGSSNLIGRKLEVGVA